MATRSASLALKQFCAEVDVFIQYFAAQDFAKTCAPNRARMVARHPFIAILRIGVSSNNRNRTGRANGTVPFD